MSTTRERLQKKLEAKKKSKIDQLSDLEIFLEANCFSEAEKTLKSINVNDCFENGDSLLARFCQKTENSNRVKAVEWLIKNKANINIFINDKPILIHVIENKNSEVAKRLIHAGANVNCSFKTTSPLYSAITILDKDLCDLLINKGAAINHTNSILETPFSTACRSGFLNIAKKLENLGVETQVANLGGMTPLMHASTNNHADVVKWLLEINKETINQENNSSSATAFYLACKSGHLEIAKLLQQNGAHIGKTSTGLSPLRVSCVNGRTSIAKFLIEKLDAKNLNEPDRNGRSALCLAVEAGHLEIVKMLIDKGVNKDQDLLLLACENRRAEIAEWFLENGHYKDQVNEDNAKGETPLILACKADLKNLVSLLLSYGADPNLSDDRGSRPIDYAVTNHNIDILNDLFDHGVDLNAPNKKGITLMHFACSNNKVDMVKFLKQKGARFDSKYNYLTPIHIIIYNQNKALLDLVDDSDLESVFDNDKIEDRICTLICEGHYKMLALLIDLKKSGINKKISQYLNDPKFMDKMILSYLLLIDPNKTELEKTVPSEEHALNEARWAAFKILFERSNLGIDFLKKIDRPGNPIAQVRNERFNFVYDYILQSIPSKEEKIIWVNHLLEKMDELKVFKNAKENAASYLRQAINKQKPIHSPKKVKQPYSPPSVLSDINHYSFFGPPESKAATPKKLLEGLGHDFKSLKAANKKHIESLKEEEEQIEKEKNLPVVEENNATWGNGVLTTEHVKQVQNKTNIFFYCDEKIINDLEEAGLKQAFQSVIETPKFVSKNKKTKSKVGLKLLSLSQKDDMKIEITIGGQSVFAHIDSEITTKSKDAKEVRLYCIAISSDSQKEGEQGTLIVPVHLDKALHDQCDTAQIKASIKNKKGPWLEINPQPLIKESVRSPLQRQ